MFVELSACRVDLTTQTPDPNVIPKQVEQFREAGDGRQMWVEGIKDGARVARRRHRHSLDRVDNVSPVLELP